MKNEYVGERTELKRDGINNMNDYLIDKVVMTNEGIRKYDNLMKKVNQEAMYHDFPTPWKVVPDTVVRVKSKVTAFGLLMALRP